MRPFIDKPHFDEPLSRRLRSTTSRINKGTHTERHQQPSGHLPSPRLTNPSSTDNISSSSSIPPKSKSKPAQSFRDRLFPLPKKPTPLSPVDGLRTANKKPTTKPSIAPFFQRVEAAFQTNPTPAKANHANTKAQAPRRSPSPDPDDLINQLKGLSTPNLTPAPFLSFFTFTQLTT